MQHSPKKKRETWEAYEYIIQLSLFIFDLRMRKAMAMGSSNRDKMQSVSTTQVHAILYHAYKKDKTRMSDKTRTHLLIFIHRVCTTIDVSLHFSQKLSKGQVVQG